MIEPPVSLLHNMSAPSKTIISYCGLMVGDTKQILFSLPAEDRFSTAEAILQSIAGAARNGTYTAQECRSLLNNHALSLPFPAAVLVQQEGIDPKATVETNLLIICTVLSKSSDRVYLRDKEPNLTSIRPGRRIAFLLTEGVR